jgi:hypothetical protein
LRGISLCDVSFVAEASRFLFYSAVRMGLFISPSCSHGALGAIRLASLMPAHPRRGAGKYTGDSLTGFSGTTESLGTPPGTIVPGDQ